MSKVPTIPLPQISAPDGYDSENFRKYTPRNRLYRKHLERFHREVFEQVLRVAPTTVLEVGCGEGFLLHVFREYGALEGSRPTLVGVDVRIPALHYADSFLHGEARLTGASAYALPFTSDEFDLVVCSQVLEHLRQPEAALAELARVSRSGVLVTVPREPLFRTLAAVSTWLGIGGTPGHLNFWSAAGFRRLLETHLHSVETSASSVYRIGLGYSAPAEGAGAQGRHDENAA